MKHDKILLFDTLKEKLETEISQIEENRRLLYLELKRHELYENVDLENNNSNSISNGVKNENNMANNNLKRKLPKKLVNDESEVRKKKAISVTDILLNLRKYIDFKIFLGMILK